MPETKRNWVAHYEKGVVSFYDLDLETGLSLVVAQAEKDHKGEWFGGISMDGLYFRDTDYWKDADGAKRAIIRKAIMIFSEDMTTLVRLLNEASEEDLR